MAMAAAAATGMATAKTSTDSGGAGIKRGGSDIPVRLFCLSCLTGILWDFGLSFPCAATDKLG
jgi:hypothetical protein